MSHGILLESGTNELELLVFTVGDTAFGINVAKVRELIQRVKTIKVPHSPAAIEGSFQRREEILTLINLAKYLGIDSDDSVEGLIVIIELNNLRCGVLVNRVEMIHRLRWEQIEPPSHYLSGLGAPVTAVAKINDRVILILDFEAIVGELLGGGALGALPDDSVSAAEERKEVELLFADDSPTVRDTLANVLSESGFTHVTICHDGQDAWNAIEERRKKNPKPFDIVLTDIEMPRMDGLHLTQRIKSDPVLREMYVILFSSIISSDTQNKGSAVGADAQIAKSDSKKLVTTIDKFITQKP